MLEGTLCTDDPGTTLTWWFEQRRHHLARQQHARADPDDLTEAAWQPLVRGDLVVHDHP